MPEGLPNYGVWKLGPGWDWDLADARTNNKPHVYVRWEDPDKGSCNAAINVNSSSRMTSRLVHWEDERFSKTHQIIPALTALPKKDGPHKPDPGSPLRLDLLRGGVITTPGRIWVQTKPGPNNDLVDQIIEILQDGVDRKATLYILGALYDEGDGIHDVHQNQGNFYLPDEDNWFDDNGVGQDGGLFFYFPDTATWTTVFLAFASQAVKTDDETGIPLETFNNERVLDYQDTISPLPDGRLTTPPFIIPTDRNGGPRTRGRHTRGGATSTST